MSSLYKYIITIRKHRVLDYVLPHDFHLIIEALNYRFPKLKIIISNIEIGKYNQLHLHLFTTNPTKITYTTLPSYLGFQIYYSPIVNYPSHISRAYNYVTKQLTTKNEQDIIVNKYTHKKAPNYFI